MRYSILIVLGFIIGCEAVTFLLPPDHRSRSDRSESSSSSSSSSDLSSSSSSDSSAEFVKNEEGKFSHLRKDDDLLVLKRRKRKGKKKPKKPIPSKVIYSLGGKQEIGFIWQKEAIETAKGNGWSAEMEKLTEGIVSDPLNKGWWLFTFGQGKNLISKTSFKFKTSLPVLVSTVDLLCRGDSFAILNSGKLIAQSSRIRGVSREECEDDNRMISPEDALKDGRWSNVIFELEAGDHEITIKTVDSPMENGGIAAIKFDHILQDPNAQRKLSRSKVCRGYNGFIVITEAMTGEEAQISCLNLKTDFAKIHGKTKDEMIIVRRSIKACTTGNTKVWAIDGTEDEIKIFNRDGKGIKGRSEDKYPVLCKVRS